MTTRSLRNKFMTIKTDLVKSNGGCLDTLSNTVRRDTIRSNVILGKEAIFTLLNMRKTSATQPLPGILKAQSGSCAVELSRIFLSLLANVR